MKYQPIPVLKFDTTKNTRLAGQYHGETLKDQIAQVADIRWGLVRKEPGFNSDSILKEISLAHLPILEKFDKAIYDELIGISEGSGQSVERIVVLNHYTDLRDLSCTVLANPSPTYETKDDGGCSALYVRTPHGPILGQTWDIHSSALPFVTLLEVTQLLDDGAASKALIFSMAGCLGMTGLNSQGIAITINNLSSIDATIGVVWPALVRKVLRQKNALEGKECIMNAPIGSGHHYIVADDDHLFAISTSGTKKKIITQDNKSLHFHTNHCVDAEMAKTHTVRKGSSTYLRHATLTRITQEQHYIDAAEVFETLGEVSYEPLGATLDEVGTCGAIVMDIRKRTVFACAGPPSKKFANPPSVLHL